MLRGRWGSWWRRKKRFKYTTASILYMTNTPSYPPRFSYSPQVQKKKSGLAIASLILAILFLVPFASIIAVILGIVALNKISSNANLSGKGFAVAGIIIGGVFSIVWVFLYSSILSYIGIFDIPEGAFTESAENCKDEYGHYNELCLVNMGARTKNSSICEIIRDVDYKMRCQRSLSRVD